MKSALFTVGPVQMYPDTLRLGGEQVPYFRTEEFSKTVFECDSVLRSLAVAPEGSRTALLTCSGTGGMEAAVVNAFGPSDCALILRGGSFGERFCEICDLHGIGYTAWDVEAGGEPDYGRLAAVDLSSYKALIVNAHETSTGALYNLSRLGDLCRRAGILFIVDAISCFLCDPIDMKAMGIDALILSSQKALALPPGLAMILMSPHYLAAVEGRKSPVYYLDLNRHLKDMDRGQTPFTPAVGIILQLRERLAELALSGVEASVARCASLASRFRSSISTLPFRLFPSHPSNALTALSPTDGRSAYEVYLELKERHGLIVTPNGGALRDKLFRVGHMGNLSEDDLDELAGELGSLSR
jgi:aspartate aminotransferase-like enzyme